MLAMVRAIDAGAIAEGAVTSIGISRAHDSPISRSGRGGAIGRQLLLACGIVSSLLYAATDILGGLQYEGYSFTSQAISELMAVGAPSEPFVDPLFITSGLLSLAFAVGVFREAAGRNRALQVAGALMIAYTIAGFTGPTLFEMHPRGAATLADDTPHIVLTGVLVALTLLTIGFGAFALGKRFRVYSFATLATMITLGATSGRYGALLAAGEPTPGFGVIERVLIYSSMLWFGVLAVALLRQSQHRVRNVVAPPPNAVPEVAASGATSAATPAWHGRVQRGLLLCGIVSSLLYVLTDVLGGLRYEGYSFTAHTISELGAIGAPSKPFVDPLFMTYGLLLTTFGVGVAWESAGRSRALFTVGSLLTGIAIVGLVAAPFSAVHVRGAERTFTDIVHIVVISLTVLAILIAVVIGAAALGTRFRHYSIGTLLILIASGALIGAYGSQLAAGQPTPGLGIVERVNVYAYLAWVVALSLTLRRHQSYRSGGPLP